MNLEFSKPALVHATVFEDNNWALGLATAPKVTPRTKHIAIKYHWFKSHIGVDKKILLQKVESKDQKADILTKGLTAELFAHNHQLLIGW